MAVVSKARMLKMCELASKEADRLRENAERNGQMHDGGQGVILKQIHAFVSGLNAELPEFLKPYERVLARQEDPEYTEYMRLHRKFG